MSTEPSCLLDTGVVIACLRGLAEVTSLLSHLVERGPLAVSAITVLEVWQGAKEREIKATRAFFDGVRVIALDQSSSLPTASTLPQYPTCRYGILRINLASALKKSLPPSRVRRLFIKPSGLNTEV
ncbi:MAG: hypothetical protein PWP58_1352 [Bacillota bacterium]|jgi:hypothetical protein|nr:hypothetical protein [Bacillota bacterium]